MVLGAAALVVAVAGCADESANRVVVWSDIPEVAAYIELFNSAQSSYRAELQYHERPAERLRRAEDQPDLLISRYLANRDTAELMRPLDRLLSTGRVDEEAFYPDLLALGRFDGSQRFLPLSFDLPVIMFNRDADLELGTYAIDTAELRELGSAFNQRSDGRFTRMGFSPQWNAAFLYTLAQARGVGFREADREMPDWSETALSKTLEYLEEWEAEHNEGNDEVARFTDRYLYDPDYQLLMRERIRFAYRSASDFFSKREAQREALDYRWLADDRMIRVLDGPVSTAISRTAQNRDGAESFLEWLYRRETQELLLQDLQRKRIQSFGILGGFSAVTAVNEELFPRYYPELLGRVPPNRFLRFPNAHPEYWQRLRRDEIEPWLKRRLTQGSTEQSLEQRLRTWLMRRGD